MPPLSRRGPLIGLLLVCTAGPMAACGVPADRARIEPTYDRTTGRLELLKYDANGDGRTDTWSYMDGADVVRIEIDTNHDSVVDRWEYYRADGQLEKIGSSRRQDGSPDSWAYYSQDGSIARLELATQATDRVDRIEHYENGAIVRAEEDTSGDGRMDKWEVYEGSRLASVAFDTEQRGYPDHRLVYGTDGSAQPEAVSPPSTRP